MTEREAQQWIADRFGDAAVDLLARFAALLIAETARQNLIAPSTTATIWARHIVDSAQLAEWGAASGLWIDIGTGGGLPGIVLALLLDRQFCLVEPRRLRADFLRRCVDELGLGGRVTVEQVRIEMLRLRATTISARAVGRIEALVASARQCANVSTIWVLPRGQSGVADVQGLSMSAPATFHVKPSLSEPTASIVIATGIAA